MATERDEISAWLALPTETEIYILPNGEIVVADLPSELGEVLAAHRDLFLQTAGDDESPSATPIDPAHVADQQYPS
jgi:hypothetical protein